MSRCVCAVLLLTVLAGPATAQQNPLPGTPANPLPASDVQVGSTFAYSVNYYIVILGYGWLGNVPYVVIGDSYDGSTYTVFLGDLVSATHPNPVFKNLSGPGFSVYWDDTSNQIVIILNSGGLLTTTNYGPIPIWEISS
jgi:hypothetical protein